MRITNKIKTDCVSFKGSHCTALKNLFCNNGHCSFYKKKDRNTEYLDRVQDRKNRELELLQEQKNKELEEKKLIAEQKKEQKETMEREKRLALETKVKEFWRKVKNDERNSQGTKDEVFGSDSKRWDSAFNQ